MSIIGLIVSVLWLILYIILFVYAVNGIVDGTIPTPTEGFYFFNTRCAKKWPPPHRRWRSAWRKKPEGTF